MINSTHSVNTSRRTRVSTTIKDLSRKLAAGHQEPAIIFGKIDELFLTAAQAAHARNISLNQCISNYWKDYFPDVEFDDEIEDLLYRYRRGHRDWIWPVFKGQENVAEDYVLQLKKTLKFRTLVKRGLYGRNELLKADANGYYGTEVAVFLGDRAYLSEKGAKIITDDGLIRELDSIYNSWTKPRKEVFVNSLIDQTCILLVLMELISGERFEPGMETGNLVKDAMEELWPIMPQEMVENTSYWIDNANRTLMMQPMLKIFRPLLSHNYSDIRDMTIKNEVKTLICTAHVIAESEDSNLSDEEIIRRVSQLLEEAFNMDSGNLELTRSIQKAVNLFYPQNADYNDKHLVWHFLDERKLYVDKWYQWIIQKDKNLADKERQNIARMWAEYNERLYLAENSIRKEVITDLIRDLSNKNYGNILSEMYLISQDRSKEDPREILRSFFLLLKNSDFGLEPFTCNNHECPGWMINGEIIVDPNKED